MEIKEVKETDKQKFLTPGKIFGELSLLTHKRWRPANIYALEDSSVLKFSNQQINRIIKVCLLSRLGTEHEGGVPGADGVSVADISRLRKRKQLAAEEDHRLLQASGKAKADA